ncbi:MAG: Hpt domain-containing protein [Bacteroidales bacterium]|jgi:HPt (histidine-containing phosphotransfer) domain-containing protein|nr:Hpt domain-containing protein [Bacteroidales bacterium]
MNRKFKYVKLSYLKELSEESNDFIAEMINIFIRQVPVYITNMNKYLKDRNYEALNREAHTAKSSAMVFNMEETAEILKEIELTANDNNRNSISALISKAGNELNLACRELTDYLSEITNS